MINENNDVMEDPWLASARILKTNKTNKNHERPVL